MTEQDWVSVSLYPTDVRPKHGVRHIVRLLPRAVLFAALITNGCGLFDKSGHGWSARFDGQAGQAHQLSDGGYIILDRSGCRLIRTDSGFGLLWSAVYPGYDSAADAYIGSVLTTTDGGYLLTGSENNGARSWSCKTDSSGARRWGVAEDDFSHSGGHPNSTCRTADGGYMTTGGTLYDGARLVALYRFGEGYTGWLGLGGPGCGDWVVQTNDHGYLVACSSPAQLCRFDSAGTLDKARFLREVGVDSISFAYLDPEGGCVIADGGTPPGVVKLGAAGNEEWQRTFDEGGYTQLRSVQPTSDGGFVLAGTVNGQQHDVALVKLDSVGTEEWSSKFGGAEDEYGEWAEQTAAGGYIVTGTEIRFDSMEVAHYSIIVGKTDANGD